jgi:hypothetical protein
MHSLSAHSEDRLAKLKVEYELAARDPSSVTAMSERAEQYHVSYCCRAPSHHQAHGAHRNFERCALVALEPSR